MVEYIQMKNETMSSSDDFYPTKTLAELKEQRPDLFEPIPTRIGVTPERPDGVPNGDVEGWRDTDSPDFNPVIDNGELLVNIANLTPPIFTTGDYSAKLHQSGYEKALFGATTAQYLRTGTAKKLIEAQKILPAHLRLIVFDAWRSLDTQYATYEICYKSIIDILTTHNVLEQNESLTTETKEIISKETQKYISLPSPLPDYFHQNEAEKACARQIPSPHNTGGSVDLGIATIDSEWLTRLEELESIASGETGPFSRTKALANFEIAKLYREHASGLDFGTTFDFAGQQSALTFSETDNSLGDTARDNRRMLYNVMTRAGFEPYSEEWWHFNDGNQMAMMTQYYRTGVKQPASYGNALLTNKQQEHEHVHKMLIDFLITHNNREVHQDDIPELLRSYGATTELVTRFARFLGDIRTSNGFEHSWDMRYRGELSSDFVTAIRRAQDIHPHK